MLPLSEVVNYVWKTAYRFAVTEYKTMEEKVCYNTQFLSNVFVFRFRLLLFLSSLIN